MSPDLPAGAAVLVLLGLTLAVCALSCLGLLVMKGMYDKLHYLSPPAILGTAAVATAITVQEGIGTASCKAWLVFLVVALGNPVLCFATARTHYLREAQKTHRDREEKREPGDVPGKKE